MVIMSHCLNALWDIGLMLLKISTGIRLILLTTVSSGSSEAFMF